jgi:thymidylate kinase
MNTIQVFTTDASLLSIDLIWQLKRRNIEILDAKKVIASNFSTNYGVKSASNIDIARYVVMFYILNNAKIPSKYLVYQEAIKNSKEAIDVNISEYFTDSSKDKNIMLTAISNNKSNKGLPFITNTFNYMIDTMKNSKKSNGFILTFSGVDGAGKSTVIENIAYRIEKQFRKPVVILRHRPSVLPILSVWSKGKEKAHLDTISNLPRQGKNSNFISSLLRFTYYYCDYLFGQFVIYFKHISRGHVVIYDRYYFDFINDSKRSNIVLPKSISRIGYHLLLKPKYNFFLFADADVILNRKKELSKETIEHLTNDYTQLFQSLQSKTRSTVYMPINNIDLETTLTQIIKTVNLT